MTTGELVFYSGVGLLAFTLLLAVVFLIKRPKYVPENLSNIQDGRGSTQKLRSGYPTETMTHERAGGGSGGAASSGAAREQQAASTPAAQGTVPLEQGATPLEQGTAPLEQGTTPLEQDIPSPQQGAGGTELLSGGYSRRS